MIAWFLMDLWLTGMYRSAETKFRPDHGYGIIWKPLVLSKRSVRRKASIESIRR